MKIREAITYDDVLLVPKYSAINSRSSVDLDAGLNRYTYRFPIIPANMKTVMSVEMANAIANVRGLAILHRFMPLDDQIKLWQENVNNHPHQLGMSIGVKDEDFNNVRDLIKLGVKVICIDIAHGDSEACVRMCKHIRGMASEPKSDLTIIAGNVATAESAMRLWEAGATTVKVGVGPGSLCSTRIETGNGVPQLTALMDVAKARKKYLKRCDVDLNRAMTIIADGGIKTAGDCVKALCFADMVMVGNLFAGTDEAPGETIIQDGISYKRYDGSSTHKSNHIEGVTALVKSKGSVKDIIQKLSEGIRSGCSYQGVNNLYDLKLHPKFVRVTNASLKESHPHNVLVIK